MFKAIYKHDFIMVHTFGSDKEFDVDFQKLGDDGVIGQEERLGRLLHVCSDKNLPIDRIATVRFVTEKEGCCQIGVVCDGDRDAFSPGPYNAILTLNPKVTLIGLASDECMFALVGKTPDSKHTLARILGCTTFATSNIVMRAINELCNLSISPANMELYIGASLGSCHSEWDYAEEVFTIASHAGVGHIEYVFERGNRCTYCAKNSDETYKFFSKARAASEPGISTNGCNALILGIDS